MRCSRWIGWLLVALAAGLAANSLLGPLVVGAIEYHYATAMTNQGIGLDAVALFGAVPVALGAGVLVLRGHCAGLVLAFAPATFAAYMMPQYVIGPDYLGLPGNNQRFIPFHIGVFVLAVAIVLGAWHSIGAAVLPPDSPVSDRRRRWVLIGLAAFIAVGRWLPAMIDAVRDTPTDTAYLDNPTAFWTVGFLDLGMVVPAAIATTVALRRGAAWGRKAAYAVIGWFSLVPASVAAMAITMQINDDPLATTSNTVTMTVAALVFLPVAVLLYRPLFTQRPQHTTAPVLDRTPQVAQARIDTEGVRS
jgi:hypothetical protein